MCRSHRILLSRACLAQSPFHFLSSFDWGYSWSNYSYQFSPNAGSNFTAHVTVCAYQRVHGLGSKMLTGYGSGVNLVLPYAPL